MNVPVGAIYLALKADAPLLTLVTSRRRGRGAPYRTAISAPLPLRRDLPVKKALEAGADLVAERLESFLSAHPGDWHFWDEFRPGRFLVEAS
jgi:lauroyl/myristoyl acyltransferase